MHLMHRVVSLNVDLAVIEIDIPAVRYREKFVDEVWTWSDDHGVSLIRFSPRYIGWSERTPSKAKAYFYPDDVVSQTAFVLRWG